MMILKCQWIIYLYEFGAYFLRRQSPDRMPLALSSIGQRPQGNTRSSHRQINKRPVDSAPLFVPEDDDGGSLEQEEEEESPELQIAIQESIEEQEAEQMRAAIELSRSESASYGLTPSKRASSSRQILTSPYDLTNEDDDDLLYTPLHKVPSRLGTALTFANTTPQQSAWASHSRSGSSGQSSKSRSFGAPVLLLDHDSATPSKSNRTMPLVIDSESEESLEEVEIVEPVADDSIIPELARRSNQMSIQGEIDRVSGGDALRMDDGDGDEDDDLEAIEVPAPEDDPPIRPTPNDKGEAAEAFNLDSDSGEDENMEVVDVPLPDDPKSQELESTRHCSPYTSPGDNQYPEPSHPKPEQQLLNQQKAPVISTLPGGLKGLSSYPSSIVSVPEVGPSNHTPSAPQADTSFNSEDEWEAIDEDGVDRTIAERDEADWDAAQEIDVQEEEGEFARFSSQIQGRDLAQVRNEIDEEIRVLHQQRKAAMRDSEDITQQMISQIMVR
jgi:DNA excision repair protein ERCC-5